MPHYYADSCTWSSQFQLNNSINYQGVDLWASKGSSDEFDVKRLDQHFESTETIKSSSLSIRLTIDQNNGSAESLFMKEDDSMKNVHLKMFKEDKKQLINFNFNFNFNFISMFNPQKYW